MDKIEWTFILIGELSLPVPVGSAKQKMQFGKNHPTVTWGFKQIESIRVSVDKSKCQLARPSLADWWLLKILSDLQINICSPGRDRKYLRTNNKIFRKLTIQHLLLTGFILNNLLKYLKDTQNINICWSCQSEVVATVWSSLIIIISVSITKSSPVPYSVMTT